MRLARNKGFDLRFQMSDIYRNDLPPREADWVDTPAFTLGFQCF